MSDRKNKLPLRRWQQQYRGRYDSVALLIYLMAVYVWSLPLGPLGGDFFTLYTRGEGQPWAVQAFLGAEMTLFGPYVAPYHFVNLLLLYGCTLSLYALLRHAMSEGPIWLATLAATLFMANPVHSDGVLHLTSAVQLLPALSVLAALALYARTVDHFTWGWYSLTLVAVAVSTGFFDGTSGLVALVLLYEGLVLRPKEKQALSRLLPVLAAGIAGALYRLYGSGLTPVSLKTSLAPLYFIFYPIGFLAESERQFQAHPSLSWIASAAVFLVLLFIHRKVRSPLFLFGILGAAAYRVAQQGGPVDPVHLGGGGQLLAPTALFNVALASMFASMLAHPKWRRAVVSGTTIAAIVLFGLQVRAISDWRHAASQVAAFQQRCAKIALNGLGPPVGVIPDYQFYRGAPMMLSSSIEYDTAFSDAHRYESLLRLHYGDPEEMKVVIESASRSEIRLRIDSNDPEGLFAAERNSSPEDKRIVIHRTFPAPRVARIVIRATGGFLPTTLAPAAGPDP